MLGVDLSNHNGTVDWNALRNAGVTFAYCKASEGVDFVDAYFADNRIGAAQVGIAFGAYHYCRPTDNNPVDEAQHFAAVVGSLRKNDLRPMLDWEVGTTATWPRLFMIELERLLDVRPALYSYPAFLALYQAKDDFDYLRQWPLWLADYGSDDGTEHPISNDFGFRVIAHQFTDKGTIANLPAGTVDLDSAPNLNDLRETGDYLRWRNWRLAGADPDAKPSGLPTSWPRRWVDSYADDVAGIAVYCATQTAPLQAQVDSLNLEVAQLTIDRDHALAEYNADEARIAAAKAALAG